MASLFNYGKVEYLNIDATVGSDGVNNHDDVYVVQALLSEVLTYRSNTQYSEIGQSFTSKVLSSRLNPTGTFDANTAVALADYKRICNEMAEKYPALRDKAYYDKHIDPIRGSIFAFGTNKRWAIARLNDEIREFTKKGGYQLTGTEYMFNNYPDLVFMFR